MLSKVDAQLSEQKLLNEGLQKEKDVLQERYESLVKDLEGRMAVTTAGASKLH